MLYVSRLLERLIPQFRDTVDSVGLFPKTLPFASSPSFIRTFRHALSLDERRVKFKATPWNRPTKEEAKLGTIKCKPAPSPAKVGVLDENAEKTRFSGETEEEDEQSLDEKEARLTDVEEVWFAVRLSQNTHESNSDIYHPSAIVGLSLRLSLFWSYVVVVLMSRFQMSVVALSVTIRATHSPAFLSGG
jgi:Uncharacterized alpha/beta hydrolase domain (DUF2235)